MFVSIANRNFSSNEIERWSVDIKFFNLEKKFSITLMSGDMGGNCKKCNPVPWVKIEV